MSEDWRHRANCRDVDPNVMQPEVASAADVDAAMAHCVGCPVRLECRQLAMSQSSPYGIHAGQWFGEPPRDPGAHRCEWCGTRVAGERATATYCGSRCRTAAWRARAAASA